MSTPVPATASMLATANDTARNQDAGYHNAHELLGARNLPKIIGNICSYNPAAHLAQNIPTMYLKRRFQLAVTLMLRHNKAQNSHMIPSLRAKEEKTINIQLALNLDTATKHCLLQTHDPRSDGQRRKIPIHLGFADSYQRSKLAELALGNKSLPTAITRSPVRRPKKKNTNSHWICKLISKIEACGACAGGIVWREDDPKQLLEGSGCIR